MGTVTGLTLERMVEIESAAIVSARLENWILIFTTHGGIDISVGDVRGLKGDKGNTGATGAKGDSGNISSVNGKTTASVTLTAADVSAVATNLLSSETVRGIVQIATIAEVLAGTESGKAVTPAALQALTATEDRKGIIELATAAEVAAQTDAVRAVTPSTLNSHPGIPWAMSAGVLADASVPANGQIATTVTLPANRFTQPPVVNIGILGSSVSLVGATGSITATSFILRRGNTSAAALTAGAHWIAAQYLSTSGAG